MWPWTNHTFSVFCFIHVAVEYHFRVIQIKTKKGNHGVQSGVDYYMTKSRRKFKKKNPDPRQTQRKPRVSFCGLLWYWVVSGRYVLYVHGNLIYRYDHRNTKRLLLNNQDVWSLICHIILKFSLYLKITFYSMCCGFFSKS